MSYETQDFITSFTTARFLSHLKPHSKNPLKSPGVCVTFPYRLAAYGKQLVAPGTKSKIEGHPLLAVTD